MGRINRILETQPRIRVPTHPVSMPRPGGEIEFRDVRFRYPGSAREVIRGVSFRARPGETIAVVGPTGSGKSTLVSLIPRLYDPSQGTILLDGVPLTELDPAELRSAIGMVPQEPFLFSETLAENIGLGIDAGGAADPPPDEQFLTGPPGGARPGGDAADRRGAPDARIEEAAEVAHLHQAVMAFPNGYDTVLGERGVNLSGGQKQRTSLARALARDPRILILDDALSAVDTHTEARILEDLRSFLGGRTTFIISHRVSAVMHADQILVLDGGSIVEAGTHPDLLAQGGLYATLLRRQMLEEALET